MRIETQRIEPRTVDYKSTVFTQGYMSSQQFIVLIEVFILFS